MEEKSGISIHIPLDCIALVDFKRLPVRQNGDYLLIPANNWSNTIRTEFKIRNWFEAGYAEFY
jgi:hypothetical protein